jgi:hypothetical protein
VNDSALTRVSEMVQDAVGKGAQALTGASM